MPNFIKIGGTWTTRQYSEMYTSRTFYIFYRLHGKLYRINNFIVSIAYGLQCSTVGNLGS